MVRRLILLSCAVVSIFLLNACAPATTGLAPSGALQQQLDAIRAQQDKQAKTIAQLVEQLEQFKLQLSGSPLPPTTSDQPQNHQQQSALLAEEITEPTISFPLNRNSVREVEDVAASASSYLAAFSDLAAGRWESAEKGFSLFLASYADHQYAPNARFWMASAQLSQGKVQLATNQFLHIAADPQGSAKAPAALLQLEQIYRKQGMTLRADEIAEQLRNRFPESPEAHYIDQTVEANQ